MYTMEHYSDIKNYRIIIGKQMEVELIMLSKISQIHKDRYYIFSLTYRIKKISQAVECPLTNMRA
jgi:hypothetical protein